MCKARTISRNMSVVTALVRVAGPSTTFCIALQHSNGIPVLHPIPKEEVYGTNMPVGQYGAPQSERCSVHAPLRHTTADPFVKHLIGACHMLLLSNCVSSLRAPVRCIWWTQACRLGADTLLSHQP